MAELWGQISHKIAEVDIALL